MDRDRGVHVRHHGEVGGLRPIDTCHEGPIQRSAGGGRVTRLHRDHGAQSGTHHAGARPERGSGETGFGAVEFAQCGGPIAAPNLILRVRHSNVGQRPRLARRLGMMPGLQQHNMCAIEFARACECGAQLRADLRAVADDAEFLDHLRRMGESGDRLRQVTAAQVVFG
jgi:hypothetical protein